MSFPTKNPVAGCDLTYYVNEEFIVPMVMQDMLSKHFKKGYFQLEKGVESGKLHYQIRGILHKKTRDPTKFLPGKWSPTVKENLNNYKYVTKDHTVQEGPWEITNEIDWYIHGVELKNWQLQLKEKLVGIDKRHIHCVIDPKGNNGKSTFRDVMVRRHGAEGLPVLNDSYALVECAASMYSMFSPKVIIIDMPRKCKHTWGMWNAIETIKGGHLIDRRYKYNKVLVKTPPHIVVLTNEEPGDFLTADRWIKWGLRRDVGQELPTLVPWDECNFEN